MRHILRAVAVVCICGSLYWLATGQYWDALTYATVGMGILTALQFTGGAK